MKGSGGQCAGDEQNRKKIEGGLRPPNNSFVSGFCVFFHGSKPGGLDRAAPATWGVFTPAFCVSVEGFFSKAYRVHSGRVVFVCYVGGAGVGVENDFISGIYSGSSA